MLFQFLRVLPSKAEIGMCNRRVLAQNDLLYGNKNFIFLGPVGYCCSGYHQPTVGLAKVLAFIEYKSERVASNKELWGQVH